MAGYCRVHLLLICLQCICTRVHSHQVPSFLAADDSERPFGFTGRVEEKPWITAPKAALLSWIHKLVLRMKCSWSWLSNLRTASDSTAFQCYCIVVSAAEEAGEIVFFVFLWSNFELMNWGVGAVAKWGGDDGWSDLDVGSAFWQKYNSDSIVFLTMVL